MSAKLIGEDFDITLLSEEEQIIVDHSPTEWAWDITPSKSGERSLSLVLSVLIHAEGVGEKKFVKTEHRTVVVRVNPGYSIKEFWSSYWQWILTVAALPPLRWGWKRFSAKKSNSG